MKTFLKVLLVLLLVGLIVTGILGVTGNLNNFKDGAQDIIDDIKDNFTDNTDNATDISDDKPNDNKSNILTISETTATMKNTSARGYYYELTTNTSYSFTIDLEETFGGEDVNLTYRLDAYGQCYVWDCYGDDAGVWHNTSEAKLINLSSIMSRFIQSASIDGNILTLKTGFRTLTESYTSKYSDDTDNYTIYADRFVEIIDPSDVEPDLTPNNTYADYNVEHITTYVFYIIVTDENSGTEKCLPFWMPCAFYEYDPY